MSITYKVANYLTRFCPLLCTLLSLTACAEPDLPASPVKATPPTNAIQAAKAVPPTEAEKILPATWPDFIHAQWREILAIPNCNIDAREHEPRFSYTVALRPPHKILLIACDQGAYQDAYRVFLINETTNTVASRHLWTPASESPATLIQPVLVWGNLAYEPSSAHVELTYLSAASGACGYRAWYSMEAFVAGSDLRPIRVFADTDCYNGVLVEQWPEVEFKK